MDYKELKRLKEMLEKYNEYVELNKDYLEGLNIEPDRLTYYIDIVEMCLQRDITDKFYKEKQNDIKK